MRRKPRLLYAAKHPLTGSRYKYLRLLQAVGIDVKPIAPEMLPSFAPTSPAFVFGDKPHPSLQRMFFSGWQPYILAENDAWSFRFACQPSADERAMIEHARGIVSPSSGITQWIEEAFEHPPVIEVLLRPSIRDIRPASVRPEPIPKSIVYVGGIIDPRSSHEERYAYKHHIDAFKVLIAAGWSVYVYTQASRRVQEEYGRIGCRMMGFVQQGRALYDEISRYSVGFLGFAEGKNSGYARAAMPNKTWEYLAAGIPTVACNAGPAGKFAANGRWAVACDSIRDLPDAAEAACSLVITDEMQASQVIEQDAPRFAEWLSSLKGWSVA